MQPSFRRIAAVAAGNALEVAHACAFLLNRAAEPRVMDITLALGAELLVSAGIDADALQHLDRLVRDLATYRDNSDLPSCNLLCH